MIYQVDMITPFFEARLNSIKIQLQPILMDIVPMLLLVLWNPFFQDEFNFLKLLCRPRWRSLWQSSTVLVRKYELFSTFQNIILLFQLRPFFHVEIRATIQMFLKSINEGPRLHKRLICSTFRIVYYLLAKI